MAKSTAIEDALARLKVLRDGAPSSPEFHEALGKALASKTNLLAARAAKYVGELRLAEFAAALAEAFGRFMRDPAKTDKGCDAKTAIARALLDLEASDDATAAAVYLPGVRHVQPEPTWGGSSDTAGELRGLCGLGLALTNRRDVLAELVDLLMDREPQARVAAARAVGVTGRDEGALLLRLKLLAGDASPDVIAEAFLSLVRIAPRESLPFVARFLDARDESTRESAALAIGSSRQAAGFELLREEWGRKADGLSRQALLLPLAMLRSEESLAFLLAVVETADPRLAAEAVDALRLYRHDDAARARVRRAAESRSDPDARRAFGGAFGDTQPPDAPP